MTFHYNDGRTGAILRQLLEDGANLNGTGLTLTLVLKDRSGAVVPTAGKVSWNVQATGIAQYEPAESDLRAHKSPYTASWWLTDSNSDARPAPDGEPETWKIWS